MLLLRSRVLTYVPMVVLPIVAAFDAGTIAVMRMAAPDNAAEAGRAGVSAIFDSRDPTPANAQVAFDAAKSVSDMHGETIDPTSFRIHSDGSVTLTVAKSTDTVLLKYVPGLRSLTDTQTTQTVSRSNW
ncbi:MAG: hypothetical protein ACT4QF_18970 [Sporichthyaceae bacterium]